MNQHNNLKTVKKARKNYGVSKSIFNGDYAVQTRIDNVVELYRFAGLGWNFIGLFGSLDEAEKAAKKDWGQ